jgi:hypothetical protein
MSDNGIKVWEITYLDDKNKKKKKRKFYGDNVLQVIEAASESKIDAEDILKIIFYQYVKEEYYE